MDQVKSETLYLLKLKEILWQEWRMISVFALFSVLIINR